MLMDQLRSLKSRYPWIFFKVAINAIACFLILRENSLRGETANITLLNDTPVFLIAVLVVLSYILILGPVFAVFYRLRPVRLPYVQVTHSSGRDVGIFLLCLQVGFVAFVLSEGVFIAGSTERSTSLWSLFFVFFSCDTFFLFYYAFYRDEKLYTPNALVAIVSSLIRGWIGFIMILLILESIRLIRQRRLNIYLSMVAVVFLIFGFPVLQIIKLGIRASAAGSSLDFSTLLSFFYMNFNVENIRDIFFGSFEIIIDRIQIVSQYIVTYQNSDYFEAEYQAGRILPFWLDGIHGVGYYRLRGLTIPDNLGVHLAKFLDPTTSEDVNWNSNPGVLAWMFINPLIGFIYSIYLLFLLYWTLVFVKLLRCSSPEVPVVVWLSWLIYLMPGWTGSLYLFLHTALLFYLLHFFRRVLLSKVVR